MIGSTKQVLRNIFNNPKISEIIAKNSRKISATTAKIPTRIPAKISCETAAKFICVLYCNRFYRYIKSLS